MKKLILLFFIILVSVQCKPSKTSLKDTVSVVKKDSVSIYAKPKLVVGIVVDQMRYDYLTRFWDRYSEKGFKRLITEGYLCKNNHFNYVPTYTAPGHASVYTGTSPMNHGIISNNWYNKFEKKSIYCVDDASVEPIGTISQEGKKSPHRLKTTTITDQNRLATQFKGKTIGIALKDRGAILPAGHTANAAYWFEGGQTGRFISSSYYMKNLPQWVSDFNAEEKAKTYMKTWNTLYPIETYTESGSDLNNFETGFKGKETATFPYDLNALKEENKNYSILKTTPFGNSITTDFALAAIDGEQLGTNKTTDFLTVSYSSPDYIGHNFGVNSKEIEDTYLRLDKDIERMLVALDEKVGKGNYTVFLTADHGAVEVPAYLKSKKIPAGYFNKDEFEKALTNYIGKEYGTTNLIENVSNNQVFFNYEALKERSISPEALQLNLKAFLLTYPHIDKVYTRFQLEGATYKDSFGALIQNGFNQKDSGDVIFLYEPSYIYYYPTGSTHGSALNYDTQVPLIFFGKGIKKGQTTKKTEIVDIAPTISALLGIAFPNGTTGKVLSEVID